MQTNCWYSQNLNVDAQHNRTPYYKHLKFNCHIKLIYDQQITTNVMKNTTKKTKKNPKNWINYCLLFALPKKLEKQIKNDKKIAKKHGIWLLAKYKCYPENLSKFILLFCPKNVCKMCKLCKIWFKR
jgi:hypothetical protein